MFSIHVCLKHFKNNMNLEKTLMGADSMSKLFPRKSVKLEFLHTSVDSLCFVSAFIKNFKI